MENYDKFKSGLWFDAENDERLKRERDYAKELCHLLNITSPSEDEKRKTLLACLLPHAHTQVTILSPFYTDYGYHCFIGAHTFINHNAYFMDGASISIGKHCFIGPNCGMYTATHPLLAEERNRGLEKNKPITVGDNVWIGGDVTILPGASIGNNSVIGAKSVVVGTIPSNVVALGNPCRVIRHISEKDSIGEEIES